MKRRFLLIEDDDPKREHILKYLHEKYPNADVAIAKSVKSGVSLLKDNPPQIVLLDMSLPTFDVSVTESGGRPQGFGGREIMRYMDRFGISVPTVVITGYEAFVSAENRDIDLVSLGNELAKEHPANYIGLIYYNSIVGLWKEQLDFILDGQDC